MSLEETEGWKNQEKAYEQGLNVGKKFVQNKVLKLVDEVIHEYKMQQTRMEGGNAKELQAKVSCSKIHKELNTGTHNMSDTKKYYEYKLTATNDDEIDTSRKYFFSKEVAKEHNKQYSYQRLPKALSQGQKRGEMEKPDWWSGNLSAKK